MSPTPPPQSVYQNASNFTIGTQNLTIHNGIGRNEQVHPIPDASHNRNRKASPPDSRCFPGTRKSIINRIISWAKVENPDHAQIALWLCGSVGSGKSAISQAVAEALDRCNSLAASFFFFRGAGDRSRFTRVPITLASQMAAAIPETAPYVMGAVERMAGWSVSKQMEELVYKPIQLAFADKGRAEFVSIVLDGLDECQDKEEVEEFIDHLLEYFGENPTLPLRFIIASRIEQHIQGRLETEQVEIGNLAHHLSHDDIRTFLFASFCRAAKQSRVIRAYGKWPTDEDVDTLLSHIDGSFIFASTIIKCILSASDDGLTPMERLPLALELNSGLDGIYTETLKRCSHFPHFTDILAPIALEKEPLTLPELSRLLHIPTFKILHVLVNLQTIIHIPGDDRSPITTFHTSLRDYLTTESRSGPFFISPNHHDELARQWLKLVCCASHLDPNNSNVKSISRPRVRRSFYHWRGGSGVQVEDGEPSILAFTDVFLNQCCPYYSPVKNGEPISRTGISQRFYTLIFCILDTLPIDIFQYAKFRHAPNPFIPHSGDLAFTIVRTGIFFFNYGMHYLPGARQRGGLFIVRYWVKHLAALLEGDSTLALEFLQKRDYRYESDPGTGTWTAYAYMHSQTILDGLKDDVLAAQRVIEARFPGALYTSCSVLRNREMLVTPSGQEHSDAGISVLDIFNAYRNLVLVDASPLEEKFTSGKPRYIEVKYTHEGRQEHFPTVLSLKMHQPDNPVTNDGRAYIGFSVTSRV